MIMLVAKTPEQFKSTPIHIISVCECVCVCERTTTPTKLLYTLPEKIRTLNQSLLLNCDQQLNSLVFVQIFPLRFGFLRAATSFFFSLTHSLSHFKPFPSYSFPAFFSMRNFLCFSTTYNIIRLYEIQVAAKNIKLAHRFSIEIDSNNFFSTFSLAEENPFLKV